MSIYDLKINAKPKLLDNGNGYSNGNANNNMKNDGFKFNTYSEKLNSTNGGGSNKSLNSSKSSSTRFNSSANYAKVPKSNLMHSKLPRIGGKVQKTKPKRSSNTNFENRSRSRSTSRDRRRSRSRDRYDRDRRDNRDDGRGKSSRHGDRSEYKRVHETKPTEPVVGEALSQMLELQVNTIKMSPKFDACKRSIDKASEFFNKIDLVSKDPENFIYEYFEEIKQKVDVQREELKLKIDDYSNEIIDQIDQTKTDCIKMAKEINQITTDIENLRTDLNDLVQRFDSFEFNDEKYEDINSRVDILQPKIEDILDEYKYLLLSGKDYEFEAEYMSMENVFGSFIKYPGGKYCKILKKSKIINSKQTVEFTNLCEFPKDQKFKLLYRASEDGFGSTQFHEKCDGIRNTLTIIKSTNDNIFGGYTGAAWDCNVGYINDTNSFIFSLINSSNDPFKAKCTKNTHSIIGSSTYGPTFGAGFDLHISSNSNTNQKSGSYFGHSYRNEGYGDTILAGSYYFQTKEIEVYEKLN